MTKKNLILHNWSLGIYDTKITQCIQDIGVTNEMPKRNIDLNYTIKKFAYLDKVFNKSCSSVIQK